MNRQKKISTDIMVRFRDIDSMGHVNNAVFLTCKYRLADRKDTSVTYGKGESVMVYFDYRTNRTIPIPGDFLKKISPYSEQGT
jgi:acyl-CoA thioesterase FadM